MTDRLHIKCAYSVSRAANTFETVPPRPCLDLTLYGGVQGMMAKLEEQVQKASLKFKNRMEPEQLAEMQCHSLEELEKIIGGVQRQQRDQKRMRNLNRIRAFLEAMHQFEKTIIVFVNTADMVAFIWGPIKLLLSVRPLHVLREQR